MEGLYVVQKEFSITCVIHALDKRPSILIREQRIHFTVLGISRGSKKK
jgi:hypothetical protein